MVFGVVVFVTLCRS